jgi:cell division protein FtsZ
MNLTMKEFEEIGSAVCDLASDDATVVIGTVIDPEIGDELRVTVVATGLDDAHIRRKPNEPIEQTIQLVRNGTTGQPEPTHMGSEESLHQPDAAASQQEGAETSDMFAPDSGGGIDYLDIPAFLRNQAD